MQENRFKEKVDSEQLVLFSARSMEDVAFFFDSLNGSENSRSCVCFDIKIDGLLDTESTIEASRWLSSQAAVFVPSLPLEPSALLLVDKMKPRAISLHLLYQKFGDKEIKYGLLQTLLAQLSTPIWIVQKGLVPEQLSELERISVEKYWDGV